MHPLHPIQTPQQFYDWFALVDRSVAHSQEAHYRAHLANLNEQLGVCDLLLNRLEEVENEVEGMLEAWRGVEEGGKSLKGACERLLGERVRYVILTLLLHRLILSAGQSITSYGRHRFSFGILPRTRTRD